jgi:hypothetical protein
MRKRKTIIIFMLFFISVVGNAYGQKVNGIADLPAPVLLNPPDNDTLGVNDTALVWQSVSGADSYRVLVAIDSAYFTIIFVDTTIAGDTSLSIQNLIGTKLRIGWKYYWRVNALNSSGNSPYSSARSFIAFQLQRFVPGTSWYDTDNKIINAHGGGFLYDDSSGTYYWYGEARPVSGFYSIGVSCYSSKNLYNWKFEGIVLSDSSTDSTGNTPVLERPKVIYNDSTKKYVMWMHIDYSDYSLANAGVAVSDSPTGPFKYLGNSRPNNAMSRDMTLFKDDDGKAYLFSSSENNATMYVSLLTGDYIHQSGTYKRNLISQSREAPAVFKYNNKYFMISSGTTGWAPNEARYATADSPLGPWTLSGNPCIGTNADITFGGQSTYVLPVKGKTGKFIFMADKWNSNNLISSTYIWLPLKVDNNVPAIQWYNSWDLTLFDLTTEVENYTQPGPDEYSMRQNYPNPFNPTTNFEFRISDFGLVTLKIYDILGREVATIVNKVLQAGEYKYLWNAGNLASGVYLYRIQSGNYSLTKKMLLLK